MAPRRIAWAGGAAAALALALLASGLALGKPSGGGRKAGSQKAGSQKAGSLAGRLLVARPEMNDPRFSRTVVYMVRHDEDGALGLIVNRPFQEVSIGDLLDRLGLDRQGVAGSLRMHYGGPVEPGRVFVLHTADWKGEGTEVIGDGIALTSPPGVLRAIGTGAGPRRALLFLSYSGWGPGQLEREIRAGGWVTVPADAALVFDDDAGTKWQRAMARREIDL
ncbi:MAG TPA: YqgE/AlgH family protein [Anaeromyxobacteraceae bacterium]|nr:YqgE/AlgH family protein [Anaeromyxobacteraceae bacterium]